MECSHLQAGVPEACGCVVGLVPDVLLCDGDLPVPHGRPQHVGCDSGKAMSHTLAIL